MSLLHLIWIVPAAFSIGLVTAVMCMEAHMSDEEIGALWENRET